MVEASPGHVWSTCWSGWRSLPAAPSGASARTPPGSETRPTTGGREPGSGGDVADRALGDLARPDARRADLKTLGRPVDDGTDPLDIGIPTTLGAPVGVTDVHSERRLLAADLTHRCHDASTSSQKPQGTR